MMFEKNIFIVFSTLFIAVAPLQHAFAQKNTAISKTYPNYFLITINKLDQKDSCDIQGSKKLKTSIIFDKGDSYYYYGFSKKSLWNVHDQYSLNINSNISSGYLYVFIVSARNTPRLLSTISLDTISKFKEINFSCSERDYLLRYPGVEYLAIWFSKSPIIDYQRKINGIELTIGNFIFRNIRQTGHRFVNMNKQWIFSKQQAGFYTTLSFNVTNNNAIIPIIINFKTTSNPL